MYVLALDLASRTCGLAVTKNKKVLLYLSYIGKSKNYLELQIEMVEWVFSRLNFFIKNHETLLIIEDIFVGKVNVISTIDSARTSGAIIYEYYKMKRKLPSIALAIEVREHLNLATNLSKAEYQLYVAEHYLTNDLKIPDETKNEIVHISNHWDLEYKRLVLQKKTAPKHIKVKLDLQLKELTKNSKNALSRLSTKIKNETGLDEHKADAILLAQYGEKLVDLHTIENKL